MQGFTHSETTGFPPGFPAALHPKVWEEMVMANSTESLFELSNKGPVLLVFLRFFGCSFCRQALSDIAKKKKNFEKRGIQIVLVHMSPNPDIVKKYFTRYNIFPSNHISDPEKKFYKAFGLVEVNGSQLLSFMTFVHGFNSAILEGNGANFPSKDLGDGFQMPGVFLLQNGKILDYFIHRKEYDRPNYERIVASCNL